MFIRYIQNFAKNISQLEIPMLKTIKKTLLLSLFIFSSCIFPSAFAMRRVAQAVVARTLNQAAPFRHSLAARCPSFFSGVIIPMAEESAKIDQVSTFHLNENVTMTTFESPDSFVAMDQEGGNCCTVTDQSLSDTELRDTLNQIEQERLANVNQNAQARVVDLNSKPEATPYQSSSQGNGVRNDWEKGKSESASNRRAILAQMDVALPNAKAELVSCIENHPTTVQNKTSNLVKSYSSLSVSEVEAEKAIHIQNLRKLEDKLNFYMQQKPHNHVESCYAAIEILEVKSDIDSTRGAIQKCNEIIHKFEQEAQDFENNLKTASPEEIEKTIEDLDAEKKSIADSIAQEKHECNLQNNRLKQIHAELESLRKKSARAKLLVVEQKAVEEKQTKTSQKLKSLNYQQTENNARITQAQSVLVEKQHAQEVELAQQNQEQEALMSDNQLIESQHEACTFDFANCPDSGPEKHWSDRQDALFQTIDQGYLQYDQAFNLTPQTCGFLAAHGIDYKNFQNFYGTALQQQLHQEMCDILSQAGLLQTELGHSSNLVNSIVDFADAAYDANQLGQIKTVTSLNNLSFSLLEYGQAVVTGTQLGLKGIAHTVSNLDQAAESVGKAVYYVLETVALGNYTGSNDACIQLREQRKAEIVAGLQNLGNAFANLTGPQRVQAVTQFLVEGYGAGNISKVVGGVCGITEFAAAAGEQVGAEKLGHEVAKTAQKMEQVAQEKIVQTVAEELANAEKNIDKAVKSFAGDISILPRKCKILTVAEVVTEIKKVGGKISVSNVGLFNNTKYWLEQICAKINTKIESTLLEQYNKMTQIAGNAKMSVCMDLEHIVNVGYKLVKDGSGAYHTVKFTGGHLAGTMSKLAQEGLFEIKSFVEFGGGCIEYKVKDLLTGLEFTHTEFPAHWNVEKIAQETKNLVENAISNGSLTEKTIKPVYASTSEGFQLKIITDSAPKLHDCISIENTVNRHIVTAHPYKGKL